MLNFTQEQLEAARAAKSPDELIEMAKSMGIEITPERAEGFLSPPIGELADEELDNVTGGGCGGGLTLDDNWAIEAQNQGYVFRIGRDCTNCHATSNGNYSLFGKEYKESIKKGNILSQLYSDIKCFNSKCNSTFHFYEAISDPLGLYPSGLW